MSTNVEVRSMLQKLFYAPDTIDLSPEGGAVMLHSLQLLSATHALYEAQAHYTEIVAEQFDQEASALTPFFVANLMRCVDAPLPDLSTAQPDRFAVDFARAAEYVGDPAKADPYTTLVAYSDYREAYAAAVRARTHLNEARTKLQALFFNHPEFPL